MSGAFYAFINVKAHLGRKYQWRAGRQLGPVVPGVVVAAERGQRDGLGLWRRGLCAVVFATSLQNLEVGFDRIAAFLKSPQ